MANFILSEIYINIMVCIHKYSIVIFNHAKIAEVNKIILKYSEHISKSSSHVLFNIEPINLTDVVEDLTFFRITSKDENSLNNQFNEMTEELNTVDTDFAIRNEETGEIFTIINHVGALDIKFDNITTIKKGTYRKIDELKTTKTEFGYCKGYKPTFRPLEEKLIESIDVPKETIYLFSKTSENYSKLEDYLSENIMEIDSNFELESRIFK